MTNIDIEHLKFPIGKFEVPERITFEQILESIEYLGKFPSYLIDSTIQISDDQLNTLYRPGGWTIKQVIHHLADSHMNAFIRFKLALTEANPQIKPYDEAAWANLPDASISIDTSLDIIRAIHFRWTVLLQSMTEQDFQKTYFHPEKNRSQTLAEVVLMYAWHSKHHLAHVLLPGLSEAKF